MVNPIPRAPVMIPQIFFDAPLNLLHIVKHLFPLVGSGKVLEETTKTCSGEMPGKSNFVLQYLSIKIDGLLLERSIQFLKML